MTVNVFDDTVSKLYVRIGAGILIIRYVLIKRNFVIGNRNNGVNIKLIAGVMIDMTVRVVINVTAEMYRT